MIQLYIFAIVKKRFVLHISNKFHKNKYIQSYITTVEKLFIDFNK